MKLIINADDFGLTEGVNQAIIDLAAIGTLSSTTVMVNMPFANQAIKLKECPSFSIGLHFNLTEGKPISNVQKCSSLVDAEGNFYTYSTFIKKLKNGAIKQEHILEELQAQYNKLTEILNCSPSHIDSHQNIHKQMQVAKILIHFSNQKAPQKLKLRLPKRYLVNNYGFTSNLKRKNFIFKFNYFLSNLYLEYLSKKYANHFLTTAGELHFNTLKKVDIFNWIINTEKNIDGANVYEIPCHPAVDVSGLSKSKLTDKRLVEYKALSSPSFKKAINKFELLSFNDL